MTGAVIHLIHPIQLVTPDEEHDNSTQVIACDHYNHDERKIIVGGVTLFVGDNLAAAYMGDTQAVENQAANHAGQDYFLDLRGA